MYPHAIDRYRIIEKLFWVKRETFSERKSNQNHGIGVKDLAKKAGISQATVSNLGRLSRHTDNPKRRVSRESIIRVLTRGLEAEQEFIDAILWLFDGSPLNGAEISQYLIHYLPHADEIRYDFKDLRNITLNLIQNSLSYLSAKPSHQILPDEIIASGDIGENLRAVSDLIAVETNPGQRLVLTHYPSFSTLSPDVYWKDEAAPTTITEQARKEFRTLNELRVRNIELYGERCIHHLGSIENYIHQGPRYLGEDIRRAQIRSWIRFLTDSRYPNYEIRLTPTDPAMEMNIKSTLTAFLGSLTTESPPWVESGWRMLWIKLRNEATTLFFLLAFERQWDSVPPEYSTNAKVVEYLKYLLSKDC